MTSKILNDPAKLLELLRRQIDANLASHKPGEPLMCKEDAFDISDFTHHVEFEKEIEDRGLHVKKVLHNASVPVLYEEALKNEHGSYITSTGALAVSSGAKTGSTNLE